MSEVITTSQADALRARLEDPKVAAALNTLLDHADLLAFGAVAANGLLERGDTIVTSLGDSMKDVKALSASAGDVAGHARQLADATPQLLDAFTALRSSGMLDPTVVALLGQLAGAVVEGTENARRDNVATHGVRGLLRALRDPDVARGLGVAVEIVRALGRMMPSTPGR